MSLPRPTPFSLVFGAIAPARFPALESALRATGVDPQDRDAFLLLREAAELVRALRPDEGLGQGVEALAALAHAAFLFWLGGGRVQVISEEMLNRLLQDAAEPPAQGGGGRLPIAGVSYVQVPALRVWGTALSGERPEPLDGWFRRDTPGGLFVLAAFGLHPGREGLTVVEVNGHRPGQLARPDGSRLFAPTLAGGDMAGLASVAGEEELLELAWRVEQGE